MAQLISFLDALNYIESIGYDIQPIYISKDVFKVVVWQGNKCLGEGKFEYKDWQEAVRKTTFDFYEQLKKT